MPSDPEETLIVAGREVAVSNPQKVLFPDAGYTKLDLVRYYLAVAEGALRGAGDRPNVLVRYPNGVGGEFFYQKRAPTSRPEWVEVVALKFPSGRNAEEVVPRDAAALAWMANLACLELHPHPVRADDLDHPDELRVDLDPVPGVPWEQVRDAAEVVHATLADFGLVGWPKTSGSRGMHVYSHRAAVEVRAGAAGRAGAGARGRAARAAARDQQVVEGRAPRRVPRLQPERQGPHRGERVLGAADAGRARVRAADVGRSRAVRSARFHARARCRRGSRRLAIGTSGIDDGTPCSLDALLELSARHEKEGLGDAPWPPHYRKQAGEPARVQPSRRRMPIHPLIEIGRAQKKEDALAGLERWKARHPEAAAHRRSRPMCWSIRCGDAFTPGGASASTCSTCPRRSGRRRKRSIRMTSRRCRGREPTTR